MSFSIPLAIYLSILHSLSFSPLYRPPSFSPTIVAAGTYIYDYTYIVYLYYMDNA